MMAAYRVVWFFLMVLIFAPGFIFASSAEGIEFWELVEYVGYELHESMFFPAILAEFLAYPVALVAVVLPGSSSVAPLLGEMIWEGVGLVFTVIFFMLIDPPFYRADVSME